MRLISQDGKGDMPYENFIFRACGGDIVASRDILTNEKQIVARYSTEAQALKVMEMLRSTYVNNEYYKSLCNGIVIPLPNNSDDMKEKMMATKAFRGTTIFQFPKDEEVEV